MKLRTLLSICAPFVLAATARAQVEVRLTGSTAFRAETYRTVRSMYDSNFQENTDNTAKPSGASKMTWSGTMTALFGAQTVTVRASWSGAVDGVQTVVQNLNKTYLSRATPGDTNLVSLPADFAMADNVQGNTQYATPALEDTVVGVVPFVWARSVGTPTSVDNVSLNVARGMWGLGYLPLSQFTGNAADSLKLVNLVGRDTGSGTRVVTFSETQYGVFTPATQRKLNAGDGSTGDHFVDDTVGFGSGGKVKDTLNATTAKEFAVGYLGVNDALSLSAADGQWLKYNGVTYTQDAIRNGQYTFWSYEHIMNRPGLPANLATWRGNPGSGSPSPNSFVAKIDVELASSLGGIQLSTMKVTRAAEGGPVTP